MWQISFHIERSEIFHKFRKEIISHSAEAEYFTKSFDSKFFKNFADAFPHGALLAHHFGFVDGNKPTIQLTRLQSYDIMQ